MAKCLIVDDVEVTRFTSEQIIKVLGMTSVAVSSLDEAVAAMDKERFDVILLDWHLRKASGLDLLQRIKADGASRARVVVFSGVEGADKKAEALAAGADAFLEKPTTKDKVQACLHGLGLV